MSARKVYTWVASWYGEEFAGNQMANGEIFDPTDESVAAHKTLPFGTRLALHNPETHQSHEVVIQDRGPFVEGRDLDLSHAAAERLGMIGTDLAELNVRVLSTIE